jgi:hypothetical protein
LTGIIGYGLSDFVGRYMMTTAVAAGAAANSVPAGGTQLVGNDVAVEAFPTWQAMAAQFGVAAFTDSPWARAALQGAGLGAGFALFGNLFKSAMAYFIGNTPLGQQLYLAEVEAQAAVTAATPAAGTTTTTTTTTPGLAGLPRGFGARPALRGSGARGMGQSMQPLTSAIPQSGMPQSGALPLTQPPGILTNTGDVLATALPGTPTPGGPSTGPMCAPCTSTSGGIAATHQAAMDAIRDESCLGGLPRGFGMYATFPDAAE